MQNSSPRSPLRNEKSSEPWQRPTDSLGLIAPVTLVMKLWFKQLCTNGLDWDDQLAEHLSLKVREWSSDLRECQTIKISSCFLQDVRDKFIAVELGGFADVSKRAYADVEYIRIQTADGSRMQLVASGPINVERPF